MTFFSKLEWGSYIISMLNCFQENWSIDSFYEVSFSWSCSVSLPYDHAWNTIVISGWAGVLPSCYLKLLDKLQNWICKNVGPSLAAYLEPLAHCQSATSLSLFYWYYFDRFSSKLAQLAPCPCSQVRYVLVILIDSMIFLWILCLYNAFLWCMI